MPNRVGLKDIAQALNVSVTTVSRALNNKFDISEKTKNEILKKAEELNYRPNAHAVSLRKNEFFAIGVILPTIDHYFFSTVLKGIMNKAHMANYLVIIGESTHDLKKEMEIVDKFVSHCVTGVIISPSNKSSYSNNLEILKNKRIPYIVVDRPVNETNDEGIVKFDDENGAFLATEHLINQGYKKIGFLRGFEYCSISNARHKGYIKALQHYNMQVDEKLIKTCNDLDHYEDGYLLTRQLMLSPNRPDALFTVTDQVALGAYKAAKELGIHIPTELGIVGYSDNAIAKHTEPPLTSVQQPGVKMGEQAFDFLQQCLIGNTSKQSRTFEAKLIIRESSIKSVLSSPLEISV